MPLADLLAQATMLSAPLDETDLAPIRARLFGLLRASGWMPSGAPRAVARRLSPAGSDEALLTALVRGDAAAFDLLFDRHAAQLNGHARRWLQPADAEEAVQEAFIVLFKKATEVLAHKPVNVAGFLFGTLRHKIRHALAARARETPLDEVEEAGKPSPDDDALVTFLRREDAERLAHLLARTLSPLEQDVLMLDLEDRDGPEIAASLGITPGYVRVLRHRALEKLRQALAATGKRPSP